MNKYIDSENEQPRITWRLRLGLAIFIIGFASPLLIPVIAATDLTSGWKTAISGVLALGIPEVFTIMAIAIMGKAGFNAIKIRFFSFIKKHGPADRVSKSRYRVGLVMFALPLLIGAAGPYMIHNIPSYPTHQLSIGIAGDLLLVSSLLVLGGEFWDKIKALFVHDAVARMRPS